MNLLITNDDGIYSPGILALARVASKFGHARIVAPGTHLWERVDVVLSGINLGPNVGNGIWHSGTVSAARQSVLLGCRGVAFSTPVTDDEPEFATLQPFIERAL